MRRLRDRRFSDPELQRAWDELVHEWNSACDDGFFHNGKLFVNQSVGAARPFYHSLGRVPTKVIQVWSTMGDIIFIDPSQTDKEKVTIYCDTSMTASFVVM